MSVNVGCPCFHSPNCLHTATAFTCAPVLDSTAGLALPRFSQLRIILSAMNEFAASVGAGASATFGVGASASFVPGASASLGFGGSIRDFIGLLGFADLDMIAAMGWPLRIKAMAPITTITVAMATIMYLRPKRGARFHGPDVDVTRGCSHRTLPRTTLAQAALYLARELPTVSNLSLSVI